MTQPLYPGAYPGSYPTTGSTGPVLAGALPAITAALAGTVATPGALSGTLPAATAALTSGAGSITGALSGTLTALTGTLTSAGTGFGSTPFGSTPFGSDDAGGALAATLPTPTAAVTATTGTAGGLAATLPTPSATLTGTAGTAGALAVTLPALTAAFTSGAGTTGALVATLTAPSGALTGTTGVTGTLTAAVPALSAGFTTGHNVGVLAAALAAAAATFTTTAPVEVGYGFHAGRPIPARSSRPGLTQGVRVARYNLHINQGETWQLTVPVLPDDPTTPVGLSGLVGQAQIRSEPASAVVLHEWATATGNLTITDDAVILTLPAATSSAWTWRRGVWDLELTDPGNGGTTRLLEGWVYVTPEITRSAV